MTLENDISCLKSNIPVLRTLPAARLKLVALMGERLHYPAGAVLIEEGVRPDAVVFVLAGEVALTGVDETGESHTLVLEAGGIVGDVPLLAGHGFLGTVSAKSDVEVLRLPKDLFLELLNTIPEFAVALARDLASRLYRLAAHMLHVDRDIRAGARHGV